MSKPNNWNKLVTQAARAIDEAELTGTKALQIAYWGALGAALMLNGGPLARDRKPQPQSWMAYSIGRTGFSINASMARPKRQVRAELYMSNPNAKALFHLLFAQRAVIETELGYALDWEELPKGKDTRISTPLNDTDPEDQSDWPRQHEWLAVRLGELHRVFVNRVKALDAVMWKPSADAPSGPSSV